jgi:hypothetical protein
MVAPSRPERVDARAPSGPERSDLKTGLLETASDEARLAPHPFDCLAQFIAEMRDREATHVTKFDPLELLPEALAWIQVRGTNMAMTPLTLVGNSADSRGPTV